MPTYYWIHPESESAGTCETEEELERILEEGLTVEIDEEYYNRLPEYFKETEIN